MSSSPLPTLHSMHCQATNLLISMDLCMHPCSLLPLLEILNLQPDLLLVESIGNLQCI